MFKLARRFGYHFLQRSQRVQNVRYSAPRWPCKKLWARWLSCKVYMSCLIFKIPSIERVATGPRQTRILEFIWRKNCGLCAIHRNLCRKVVWVQTCSSLPARQPRIACCCSWYINRQLYQFAEIEWFGKPFSKIARMIILKDCFYTSWSSLTLWQQFTWRTCRFT